MTPEEMELEQLKEDLRRLYRSSAWLIGLFLLASAMNMVGLYLADQGHPIFAAILYAGAVATAVCIFPMSRSRT